MKHPINITVLLVALFFFIQIFGLYTVQEYSVIETNEAGELVAVHEDTTFGEQPQIEDKNLSFLPIIIMVLIGTAIILFLVKVGLGKFWKYGFLVAVFFATGVTLGIFIPFTYAMIIAAILAFLKVFKTNFWSHNITEILIYPGITIVLLPFFNVISIIILLLLISAYDIYAVNKSKHMITLAKFQTESNAFAGLFVPYNFKMKSTKLEPKKVSKKKIQSDKHTGKSAILGGGDVAFPLIFSATIFEGLLLEGMIATQAFLITSIISVTSTIALSYLFYKSVQGKFYPAMPIITAGCLIGWAITLLF